MKGWIYVHGAEDYQKWAAENLTASAQAAPEGRRAEGARPDAALAVTMGGNAKR
jgi:heme/copper-type cytochrome/quinol oxidase subunit 2